LRLGWVEQFGPRCFLTPSAWFGCGSEAGRLGGALALRQLFATRRRANDVRLDDDISGTPDHQQMLDIVAADQHQASTTVDRRSVDHREPGHPTALGVRTKTIARESANQPTRQHDERQNDDQR
jgi:hypothetical protein